MSLAGSAGKQGSPVSSPAARLSSHPFGVLSGFPLDPRLHNHYNLSYRTIAHRPGGHEAAPAGSMMLPVWPDPSQGFDRGAPATAGGSHRTREPAVAQYTAEAPLTAPNPRGQDAGSGGRLEPDTPTGRREDNSRRPISLRGDRRTVPFVPPHPPTTPQGASGVSFNLQHSSHAKPHPPNPPPHATLRRSAPHRGLHQIRPGNRLAPAAELRYPPARCNPSVGRRCRERGIRVSRSTRNSG